MFTVALSLVLTCADPETVNLPPLFLADGLPSHAACCNQHRVAEQAHRFWAGAERWADETLDMPAWQRRIICDRQRDAAFRMWVWHYAMIATDPERSAKDRRGYLQSLVDRAGWRAVITGELPPPIPLE